MLRRRLQAIAALAEVAHRTASLILEAHIEDIAPQTMRFGVR